MHVCVNFELPPTAQHTSVKTFPLLLCVENVLEFKLPQCQRRYKHGLSRAGKTKRNKQTTKFLPDTTIGNHFAQEVA